MSQATLTLPRHSASWLTVLFAALAALAVWVGLTHPTRAVAVPQPQPMAVAAAPAGDLAAVFVGVVPNAPDTQEEPAPTF